jgi:hypothetical protein
MTMMTVFCGRFLDVGAGSKGWRVCPMEAVRAAGGMVVKVVGQGRQRFHAVLRYGGCLPDRGPSGRRYAPAEGAAGSGKEKRPRKRSTASLLPSIFRSPERSASSISRSS